MSASTFVAVSAIAAVGSAVVGTVNAVQQQKQAEAQNKLNAEMARMDVANTRAEEAMNESLLRANARRQIAAAQNAMVAAGNVGSSADASVIDAYKNLASDLSAMKFNYGTKIARQQNEVANYEYNAKVAKRNKLSAIIGGGLSAVGAAGTGYADYNKAGGKYGFNYWGKK